MWLTGGFTRTASKWKSICPTGLTDFTDLTKHKARRIDANIQAAGVAEAGQLKLRKPNAERINMVGRVELRDDFKEQAEWRREKAEQYPDDKRHLEAAAIFDRLAATIDAIPQDVFIAFSKLDVDDGLLDVERGPRCYATLALDRHRKLPRNLSDLLSRIG